MTVNVDEIKVLLVDNKGMTADGIAALLAKQEKITVVDKPLTGKDALEKMQNGLDPDVVITELQVQDMDGLEFVATIKKNFTKAKLILLTGNTDKQYVQKAFSAGVTGYVAKDASIEELVCGIHSVENGGFFVSSTLTEWFISNLLKDVGVARQDDTEWDLSTREVEALEYIGNGYTNEEIADRMFTSKRTIEGYRNSLLRKTGARNTAVLVKLAAFRNLLSIQEVAKN